MPKEPIRWQWGHRHLLMSDFSPPQCWSLSEGALPSSFVGSRQGKTNSQKIVTCTQLLSLVLIYMLFFVLAMILLMK